MCEGGDDALGDLGHPLKNGCRVAIGKLAADDARDERICLGGGVFRRLEQVVRVEMVVDKTTRREFLRQ